MILGLDASTSIVGYAFSHQDKVIDAGFIDISKIESNKDKSFYIIKKLIEKKFLAEVIHINLEAPLSGFMGGKTSQQTIIKLVRFNAILEYILEEQLQRSIFLLNVNTMRKKVLGKARIKGMKGKEMVKLLLPALVPNINTFEKINKIGNWDKHNEDMYDAIVCSLYG